ncbi:hypothetical protein NCDO763_0739 [Lactococcus cremoris]|nr:hypothetical protein N41_0231 [Lactococcus cremoris]KZK52390.1 hypothetical protein NCDO763_0739 [Lactococcus cremoris]
MFLQGYFFKKSIFLLRLSYKKFVSKKMAQKKSLTILSVTLKALIIFGC